MTQMKTLGLWNFSQWEPQKPALIDPAGKTWTRQELVGLGNQIAHGLRAHGLQAGDTVAAMLPNCAHYIAINLAVMQTGMFLAPLNWHLAASEVSYILEDSQAKAFFCHSSTRDVAVKSAQTNNFDLTQLFCIDDETFNELVLEQPTSLPNERSAGMVMFYTSGTTGKPKGVRRNIPPIDPDTNATNFTMLLLMFGIMPEQNNIHFSGSPLYHTAAMNWVTSSLHLGHCVVLHDKWDAENMLRAIDNHKVTTTHVVPTQMVRLCKLNDSIKQQYDVSSVTHLIHTAAPCPIDVKVELIDWFGPVIYEYYASTEGGGTIANSQDWLANPGTVGRAWPTAEVKILDDDGNELKAGETGTVYMLMTDVSRFEYKGDKEKTAKTQIGNFFTAGDIGHLNEEGFLFLSDRKIDMIISGGANIYPAEIENALITSPLVYDCCVFGIPNEEWGEEIKAAVQLREGVPESKETIAQLLSYLEERLARMKLPKSFDFHAELPRDPNGKIYKRNLRAPYWQGKVRNV